MAILGLGQEIYKISRDHLGVPENKKILKQNKKKIPNPQLTMVLVEKTEWTAQSQRGKNLSNKVASDAQSTK